MVNIEAIREKAKGEGLNLSQLEAKIGLGNGTIGKWNKANPNIETLKKLADYFGVSIEYFLETEEG